MAADQMSVVVEERCTVVYQSEWSTMLWKVIDHSAKLFSSLDKNVVTSVSQYNICINMDPETWTKIQPFHIMQLHCINM